MSEIKLRVTEAVMNHVAGDHPAEMQIAMRGASVDLHDGLAGVSAKNRREIILGDCITLVVGDTGAIWRTHNAGHIDEFDGLFELLARMPDREMTFTCRIAK